jgi:DNA-binding LacI/PurR family transcriptional regulator
MSLNNRPGIGDKKRQKIIEIAKKVGYQPSLVAPPFIIQKDEIDKLVAILDQSISEVEKEIL